MVATRNKKFANKRNRISHLIDSLESRLLYAGDLPYFDVQTQVAIPEGTLTPPVQIMPMNGPENQELLITVEKVPSDNADPALWLFDEVPTDVQHFMIDTTDLQTFPTITFFSDMDEDSDNGTATFAISAEGYETAYITLTQLDGPLPGMLSAPDLNAASDDGEFNDDDFTSRNNADASHKLTFTVEGTQQGDKVLLFVDGFQIGQGTASGESMQISTDGKAVIPSGEHEFTVAIAPGEGEDPIFSDSLWVIIENDAPINLSKPLNVVASTDFSDEISVTWDEVPFAESYNLYRGTTATFANADQIGSFLFDTFYDDFEVSAGTKYYYFVTATSGESESPNSAAAIGNLQLLAPDTLEATTDLADRVTLSWSEVDGAASYSIFRSESDDFSTATKIKAGATATTFDDITAKSGHEYFYWVKAVSVVSTSEESFSAFGLLGPAESTITIPKIATSTSFGKTITISPTLKSNPANAPAFTGELQLINLDTFEIIAQGEITGKTAKLITPAELPVGVYNVGVHYEGDELHLGADSVEFVLTVNAAKTTITLKSNIAAPVAGQELTLTATVGSTIGYSRSGTVSFYDNDVLVDTAEVNENLALLTFTPEVGNHKYKVVYEGDDNFLTSASTIKAVKVSKAKTKTVLTPTMLSPIHVGDIFDITAAINIIAPGVVDPSGTITFKDNNVVIGTIAVVGGEATFTSITYTKVGTHKFVATFSGDGNSLLSTSAAFTMKVLPGVARRFS